MKNHRGRRAAGLLVASCIGGLLTCAVALAADAPISLAQSSACTASADVVCTESGAVQGTITSGVRAFKGIPYAKPPVGALRFRPPQPAQAWQGTLAADRFGPVCPQLAPGNKVVGSELLGLVNVRGQPAQRPASLLPVMIWLHGGGNAGLSGAGTASFGGVVYDGGLRVERGGVVFVTIRLASLGVLGFLAHPALDAERPEKISGNYGSLDQIAMLQWVRKKKHSQDFGGDPNQRCSCSELSRRRQYVRIDDITPRAKSFPWRCHAKQRADRV